jgi:hypothetical protein
MKKRRNNMNDEKVIISLNDFNKYKKLDENWQETEEKLAEKLRNTVILEDSVAYQISGEWLFQHRYRHLGKDVVIAKLTESLNVSNRIIKTLDEKKRNASLWQRITGNF